jgi:hypothetical protein
MIAAGAIKFAMLEDARRVTNEFEYFELLKMKSADPRLHL